MSETRATYDAGAVVDDDLSPFRALLKHHRTARRWSQERLADESETDHSLVSRIESGDRRPTRASAAKLAAGLVLTDAQTETLLLAAGFVPHGLPVESEGATLGLAVWRALTSATASPVERQQLALIVRCALGLAHRAGQPEPPPVPVVDVTARLGRR